MKSPLFLFSLPRSGSTLIQTILGAHPQIATAPEPWLLLPFLYTMKKEGQLSEYFHTNTYHALKDFMGNLPNKERTYFYYLREFSENLYRSCCTRNEVYFLDKTPRYYLILPEIKRLFPEAKYIFLFRNPVHVYSSILNTWGFNRFKFLANNDIDLIQGPRLLSEGYKLFSSCAYALTYEKFVQSPESCLREMTQYLNLPFNEKMLSSFGENRLAGRMGDPNLQTQTVDPFSIGKWRSTFNTPFRKRVLSSYIERFDEAALAIQGYDKNAILKEIELNPVTQSLSSWRDMVDYMQYKIIKQLNLNLFFAKRLRWFYTKYVS